MITFSKLGEAGRLGNQLFQYAALKSAGLRRGYEVRIPDPNEMEWHGQKCLLNNFNLDCNYLNGQDDIFNKFFELGIGEFDERILNLPDETDLYGFFQNVNYFQDYDSQIREEFKLKQELVDAAGAYLNKFDKEVVSVHFRRGDNTDGTNLLPANYLGGSGSLSRDTILHSHLDDSLEYFKDKDVYYLVFSGGSRDPELGNKEDLAWCRDNFNGDNIFYSEGHKDILDFTIMSMCDHNIACHSTSFGWWAAYLNSNPNKIVVVPANYDLEKRDRQGMYPKDFIQI